MVVVLFPAIIDLVLAKAIVVGEMVPGWRNPDWDTDDKNRATELKISCSTEY